ncbi:putative AC transposase [Bienertia sinuspersici]
MSRESVRLIVSIAITLIISHATNFDQRVLIRMFAEAIMYHSYPYSMVEHVKLREMLSYLNPQVIHVTRNTILRGVDIYLFVIGLIKEWSLERKTFSMTCDNAGAMDVMVTRLKSDFLSFGTKPVAGCFFHVRCSAHILNLIVQLGMKVIDKSILKLREAVNYIVDSDARLCTFEKCASDSKCNFVGKLRLDCPTRWNSTYLMLKRALEAKDALVLFAIVDSSFEFSLTSEEWTSVQFVCPFLGPFHSITELFSRLYYPTSKLYFANVLAIEKLLVLGNNHEVDSIKKMASVMLEKFEKLLYLIHGTRWFLLDQRYRSSMFQLKWRHASRKSRTHL